MLSLSLMRRQACLVSSRQPTCGLSRTFDWHDRTCTHCVKPIGAASGQHHSCRKQNGREKKESWGLQVTDISQYGDIAAAQSVLVPAGAKVLDKSTTKVQQPPRNTGTLAGVFQAPPTTVYRYCPVLSVTLQYLSRFAAVPASVSKATPSTGSQLLLGSCWTIAINDNVCNRLVTSPGADHGAQKSIRLNVVYQARLWA